MSLLAEIARELRKMFIGDIRLFLGVLALVGGIGGLLRAGALPPLAGGAALLLGMLALLGLVAAAEARSRRRR